MDLKSCKGLLAVVVFISIFFTVHSLECYTCSATGGDNKCEDYETYKTNMENNDTIHVVVKNCTAPFDQICMIEKYEFLGATVSYIRDCSDGKTFSFTSSDKFGKDAYKRLVTMQTNNETACVWDGNHQVCLSKCDTDLCNGPSILEFDISGVAVMSASKLMTMFASLLLFVRTFP